MWNKESEVPISEIDKEAGFIIQEIPNPSCNYLGAPQTKWAALLPLTLSDRIIKTMSPDGCIIYRHERLQVNIIARNGTREWKTASMGLPTLKQVLSLAREYISANPAEGPLPGTRKGKGKGSVQ